MKKIVNLTVPTTAILFLLQAPFAVALDKTGTRGVRLPSAIKRAMVQVHKEAEASHVRNLFMFNYVYYQNGFCKDQDCSAEKVRTEVENTKNKLGGDFDKHVPYTEDYAEAIKYLQEQLPTGDLPSLVSARSAEQIFEGGIFTTCVDFAKTVMAAAIENGFPANRLKMYVTMVKAGYEKMCPARDGRKPILPRPVVHTLVAFEKHGQWHAINVENPNPEIVPVGKDMPERLSREYEFPYPPLIANQKLLYAGAYRATDFVSGFPAPWLISITVNGRLETNTAKFKCE